MSPYDQDDVARHLAEREAKNNRASTRFWNNAPHKIGLIGEIAFAEYLGIEPDLKHRPGGDGGIDQWLLLSGPPDCWYRTDVKSSERLGNLLVEQREIKPATIYVFAYVERQRGNCMGYEWGWRLAYFAPRQWPGKDVNYICHYKKLLPMEELKQRFLGYKHE